MKILPVKQDILDSTDLFESLEILRQGGVMMHATETCYGLAVDIFQKKALEKLYAIKKMVLSKPVSMMVTDVSQAQEYAEFNNMALALAKKFWPGALTLVLSRGNKLPTFFNEGHSTVGIRCPDSLLSQQIIKKYASPLSTTSANISGVPEVYSLPEYLAQLQESDQKPDLIIDSGNLLKNPPSTILAFKDGIYPYFIREGSLTEQIKLFLNNEGKLL